MSLEVTMSHRNAMKGNLLFAVVFFSILPSHYKLQMSQKFSTLQSLNWVYYQDENNCLM